MQISQSLPHPTLAREEARLHLLAGEMDGGVGPDPFSRQPAKSGSTDIEVLSRMLPIENKLFWLDLKDNPRGRCELFHLLNAADSRQAAQAATFPGATPTGSPSAPTARQRTLQLPQALREAVWQAQHRGRPRLWCPRGGGESARSSLRLSRPLQHLWVL